MKIITSETVLITGASSGIGKATAILMAREGHQVIATSRQREKLNPLIEETSSIGCPIFPEELNINKNDEVDQCFARLFERFGSVDVLVNNAGYGLKGSINSITSEQLQEQFNNLRIPRPIVSQLYFFLLRLYFRKRS